MFSQLLDIERLTRTTAQLQQAKNQLHDLLISSYTSEPRVKDSLTTTISDILSRSTSQAEMFALIEDDALQGYLIPSYIDFDSFNKDREDLPEWTRVVFEKEFQKQKQSLNVMAKKTYSVHSLSEAKDKHQRQLNCFKVLTDRYRVLSQHQETLDIMSEAEKLRNLTRVTTQKFLAFLNLIGSKLASFMQQMIQKCQQFSSDINTMAVRSTNFPVFNEKPPQPSAFQQQNTYGSQAANRTGGWLARANQTLDKSHRQQQYLLRQPRWLATYSSDYYL